MPLSELCARRWGCRAPPHTHTHAHHTHTHTHTQTLSATVRDNHRTESRRHASTPHAHARKNTHTHAHRTLPRPSPCRVACSLHRCTTLTACTVQRALEPTAALQSPQLRRCTAPTAAPVYSTYSCVCSANSTAPTAAFAALTAAPSWQSCALGIGLLCLAAGGAAAVSGHGPRGNYGLAARHDGPDHLGLWSNQAAGLWWKASHVWALWVSAQQRFFLRLSLRFHDSDGVLSLPCHPLTRLRPLPFIIFHRLSPRFCCNREPTRVHFLARERCL